ncbi:MAG: DUF58 domain-containing protein [Syntrophobacteraceae bacterium]
MIVPANRLLLLFGFTFLPMSLGAAVAPALWPLAGGVVVALLIICLADACHVSRRCGGVHAEFPDSVNVVRNRDEVLDFKVRDERSTGGTLHLALGLPAGIDSPRREFLAVIPPDSNGLKIRWPIKAGRRGEYLLPECYFRIPSRLGLWFKQGRRPAGTKIKVYPDLLSDYKKVSALFLRRNGTGMRTQLQVGRGRDFEKLRDYLPGDSMSDIHWRVTAKRGHLVTKEYQLERTQEIYVVVDASRLSSRELDAGPGEEGNGGEPLMERYISAALTLGDFAHRQGDRFGLLAFSNRILTFIRAGGGKRHFSVCRDEIFDLHAQPVTPDFGELAALILQNLRRRSLLLFLTSLDDPALAESFISEMEAVSRRHLVVVNMIKPASARPIFDDPGVADTGDIYRHLGGHLLWANLRELEILLKHKGIGFFLIDHEKLCVEMVSHYISVKRRQIL